MLEWTVQQIHGGHIERAKSRRIGLYWSSFLCVVGHGTIFALLFIRGNAVSFIRSVNSMHDRSGSTSGQPFCRDTFTVRKRGFALLWRALGCVVDSRSYRWCPWGSDLRQIWVSLSSAKLEPSRPGAMVVQSSDYLVE